ncbi:UvrD-helicase domain-containing protein, partial [Cronobacter sakazakii]|uniref:UvrD-helicase domain-containing protein n=1 Tax=Cronobacter sakazakii TaxID=28141 RepID=UPI001BCE31AC
DNPGLLEHYQRRFRHILVDEFQDTNAVQYAWLRMLAKGGESPMVVGDDDQSIYGWRGAKIENIQQFDSDFADAEIIRLEQNYRSTANILNAANALIANNQGRLGKELRTDVGDGEPLALYAAFNEHDEARYVVETIEDALRK